MTLLLEKHTILIFRSSLSLRSRPYWCHYFQPCSHYLYGAFADADAHSQIPSWEISDLHSAQETVSQRVRVATFVVVINSVLFTVATECSTANLRNTFGLQTLDEKVENIFSIGNFQ